MERKYTKCECCPYYAKVKDKDSNIAQWKCTRFEIETKCVFTYCDSDHEEKMELLKIWINANNGIEVK